MLSINGREVVTMMDSPDLSLCAAITDPCLGIGHWTDDTTPRTDRPVRFWVIPRQHGKGVRVTTHVALSENVPMVA